jgi:hypothetical protein
MKLLTLLFLFSSITTLAQNTGNGSVKDTAYINSYNKLRALYLKQLDSESHKKAMKLTDQFMTKANFNGDQNILLTDDGLMNWIKDNIEKTSFKNFEEALKLDEDLKTAYKADAIENAEYKAFDKIISDTYGIDMVIDVMFNKGTGEYDPKQEPEYINAYNKLKGLALKQRSSTTYTNLQSLEKEFYKKANFNYKKDTLEDRQTIFDWVQNNLSRTKFISLSQAEMEWNVIKFAQEAEEKENADFYEFESDSSDRLGRICITMLWKILCSTNR